MPEETIESRVFTILSRMEERQEAGFEQLNVRFNSLEQRVARLEGGFDQMDKRLGGVEQRMGGVENNVGDLRKDMRQVLFVVIGTWVTIMVTLLLKSV